MFSFLEKTQTRDFADGNTISSKGSYFQNILKNLDHDINEITILLEWFRSSSMKTNTEKFQFQILS